LNRTTFYNVLKKLEQSGWFIRIAANRRRKDGTYEGQQFSVLNHEEWVKSHVGVCSAIAERRPKTISPTHSEQLKRARAARWPVVNDRDEVCRQDQDENSRELQDEKSRHIGVSSVGGGVPVFRSRGKTTAPSAQNPAPPSAEKTGESGRQVAAIRNLQRYQADIADITKRKITFNELQGVFALRLLRDYEYDDCLQGFRQFWQRQDDFEKPSAVARWVNGDGLAWQWIRALVRQREREKCPENGQAAAALPSRSPTLPADGIKFTAGSGNEAAKVAVQ
jgi:hypothetical protein